MAKKWNAAVVVDRLRECLGPRGIDIVHPFAVQRLSHTGQAIMLLALELMATVNSTGTTRMW